MTKHRFSLVACARWEETEIEEWVAYHKSIGFDHIYLYSNDDDPAPLFRAIVPYAYGPDPFVSFRHWPHVGQQAEMYLHFLEMLKHETEWFSFLDIDEFFVFKQLDNVVEFMRPYETSVDCLYFNWFIYGHSDRVRREDGAVLTAYRRRARRADVHTKMMCRSAALDLVAIRQGFANGLGAFWHFWDNYHLPNVRCFNVLHEATEGYAADFPDSAGAFIQREGFDEALINCGYIAHFQFKSEEDFLRRWHRGGFSNGDIWRDAYESGFHKTILAPNNAVYDSYLAEYWYRYTAPAHRLGRLSPYTAVPYENVALHKPSWQSSVHEPRYQEPERSRVSGGGNNGLRTGTYGFHTQLEAQPWWQVDLLGLYLIAEIHIYNRGDSPALKVRAAGLEVLGSVDNENWTLLLSRTDPEAFGLHGAPLVVPGTPDAGFRFIKLRLPKSGILHLDEVEIYGPPI